MLSLQRTLFRALHAEGLPSAFWVLWAGAFLNRLGNFVVPFMTIFLTEQRGLSAARAGLLVSLHGAGALGASLVGGQLADRVGRRSTMVGALLLSAVAMLQLSTAQGELHLAVSVLALGFFGEMFRPAMQAMVADLVPEGPPRVAAFGALYWAANFGFACSALVAGFLSSHGFKLLFVGDAATTLGFALVALLLLPETRPAVVAERKNAGSLFSPFADPVFLRFVAGNVLLVFCFFQTSSTLPLAVRASGLSTRDFGMLMALNGLMIVLLQPVATSLLGKLDRRSLVIGALVIGAGFASHGLASSRTSWALGVALWTLGEIVVAPRISAVVADLAPAHLRGRYQGAFSFSHALGAGLGPFSGGLALTYLGAGSVWALCGAAALAAASLFSSRPERR